MANNTRALQLKANAEEYDQKLADIKRLTHALQSLVNEILATVTPPEWDAVESTDDLGGYVEVQAKFLFNGPNTTMKFNFRSGGKFLSRDSDFSLRIVRRLYDNLDILIDCAENICADCGRMEQFRAKIARFEE